MSLRVGLFGGTFDPVHNGHTEIAKAFLTSGLIDELWVLLTPYPPHKQKNIAASYDLRLKMLKEAFAGMKKLTISTIENELPKPSFSVQTIRYLKEINPNREFYYCMGEDSLSKFHTWKYYDQILKECDLMVARRPGVTHIGVEKKILQSTHFVDHDPLDISSSQIRECVSNGISIDDLVPENVKHIIEKESLYK
ncbi:nicotinate (nicotinamide) nucleotide adenylyltransferase [Gracilimonas sp.]|uniref:nicotinate (nicotinamide) nucleotide adenylyltransferase n=1 Tax=Gracilimonas sp. TaxID=1974203 RepID=UPI002871FBB0|nr:nicotinate (nicotinamide) nucleotide adenylyltransferase [Gracilimonas sp.]